jgi:hypothetical protein
MVGIVCSGLFAFKLLPVLLVVVPSLVRACTLILEVDLHAVNQRNKLMKAGPVRSVRASRRADNVDTPLLLQLQNEAVLTYSDPAFSRSNVHSVLAIASMLTPVLRTTAVLAL